MRDYTVSHHTQRGMSLFEVMLMFLIVAMITMSGFKIYQTRLMNINLQKIKINVDQLFAGASNFYRINCSGLYDSAGVLTPGRLNPQSSGTPSVFITKSQALNISTDLIATNFITDASATPSSWKPNNPLVDTGTPSTPGYVVQFNPVNAGTTPYTMTICTSPSNKPCTSYASAAITTNTAVMGWTIQVSVLLKDATKADTYQKILNAKCQSNYLSAALGVVPCVPTPTKAGYLVWEQLPTSPQVSSTLWMSMPGLKTFNDQYTHDQIRELNGGYNGATQYYLCGG